MGVPDHALEILLRGTYLQMRRRIVHNVFSEYYRSHANKHERTARFMERIGIDPLKSELRTLIPYIPIEKVNET